MKKLTRLAAVGFMALAPVSASAGQMVQNAGTQEAATFSCSDGQAKAIQVEAGPHSIVHLPDGLWKYVGEQAINSTRMGAVIYQSTTDPSLSLVVGIPYSAQAHGYQYYEEKVNSNCQIAWLRHKGKVLISLLKDPKFNKDKHGNTTISCHFSVDASEIYSKVSLNQRCEIVVDRAFNLYR
ncbi:exported hypothetical protein [uncultured Gammaproteobacteria bacterium]